MHHFPRNSRAIITIWQNYKTSLPDKYNMYFVFLSAVWNWNISIHGITSTDL
jgi:hypothetical protein